MPVPTTAGAYAHAHYGLECTRVPYLARGQLRTRRTRRAKPEQSPQQMAVWIERFFRLWCQNQWKRERMAPSFHLDDRNVDPRSWCRFPILSGGFERELAEMRAFVSMGKAER